MTDPTETERVEALIKADNVVVAVKAIREHYEAEIRRLRSELERANAALREAWTLIEEVAVGNERGPSHRNALVPKDWLDRCILGFGGGAASFAMHEETGMEKPTERDTRRDVAEQIAAKVRKRIGEAVAMTGMMQSMALAAIEVDLRDEIAAALLRSEGRRSDHTAVEEAWDHATNVAMTVVEEYKRGEVSEAIMRGTLRNAPMYVESRIRLLGTSSDSPVGDGTVKGSINLTVRASDSPEREDGWSRE